MGANDDGRIGDGTTMQRTSPVAVLGVVGATALVLGHRHACVILGDRTVRCWGNNSAGQLGDGTMTNRSTPVAVAGLSDVVELSLGNSHSCARLMDGTARCWGRNGSGELGDGTMANSPTPVAVNGLTDVAQIAVGDYHTCARTSPGGAVYCWGANGMGQLGDGTGRNRLVPTRVSGLAAATGIALAAGKSCAILSGGELWCWGRFPGTPTLALP
ncbi:MAG: hypothetical protein M5U28_22445 [Sandaracinaceae bacterium]|nr:hypothetical protein [Sandaracinaceae bacterium]